MGIIVLRSRCTHFPYVLEKVAHIQSNGRTTRRERNTSLWRLTTLRALHKSLCSTQPCYILYAQYLREQKSCFPYSNTFTVANNGNQRLVCIEADLEMFLEMPPWKPQMRISGKTIDQWSAPQLEVSLPDTYPWNTLLL